MEVTILPPVWKFMFPLFISFGLFVITFRLANRWKLTAGPLDTEAILTSVHGIIGTISTVRIVTVEESFW